MTLSERLKILREKAGLSASALSKKADLSKNSVSQIEDNPSRSPSVDNVAKLASALGVSFSYLALGLEEEISRGKDVSQATPWTPPTAGGERPDLEDARRKLPQTLAPSAREPSLYKLRISIATFGYMQGDVLVVDLRRPAKDGDVVLAQMMDLADGSSSIIVRRLFSPFLISPALEEPNPVIVADGARTKVIGVVAASFRAPQLDYLSPI